MVKVYRGTNFEHLAKNFEGDIIKNKTDSEFSQLYATPRLEIALNYATNYSESKHPFIPLILELIIPEDKIYDLRKLDENREEIIYTQEKKLIQKAKKGEQVFIRRSKGVPQWKTPFIKTKFLKSFIEIQSDVESKKKLKSNSRSIRINGRSDRVEKYIKKRRS